jgi:hypothetical protein
MVNAIRLFIEGGPFAYDMNFFDHEFSENARGADFAPTQGWMTRG